MLKIRHWTPVGGLLAMALLAFPQEAHGQRSGVEVWAANCGRCHSVQPPNRYTAKDWQSLALHMTISSRLTDAEGEAVTAFLLSGARRVGAESQAAAEAQGTEIVSRAVLLDGASEPPTALYQQHCVACHGAEGKGNGVAAAAFDPRPTDLSDAAFWAERTDSQVVSILRNGKAGMPAFAEVMGPGDMQALVRYLRTWFTGKDGARAVASQP